MLCDLEQKMKKKPIVTYVMNVLRQYAVSGIGYQLFFYEYSKNSV